MTPLSAPLEPLQAAQTDLAAPRFFLDTAIDANPADGDWWLDIGGVDLPETLTV